MKSGNVADILKINKERLWQVYITLMKTFGSVRLQINFQNMNQCHLIAVKLSVKTAVKQ